MNKNTGNNDSLEQKEKKANRKDIEPERAPEKPQEENRNK
ncbi:3-methyladenine DNA glycosylase [Bacillus massilinigeriensis]|nr:3-methyladenine DNA glycosylase [Bacillus mediterraneensis]